MQHNVLNKHSSAIFDGDLFNGCFENQSFAQKVGQCSPTNLLTHLHIIYEIAHFLCRFYLEGSLAIPNSIFAG